MASIFTRIIQGELPAYIVAQNAEFVAFLDINPLQRGHTLVATVAEIDYIFDQSAGTLARLLPFCQEVAGKIQRVVPCRRIGMAVVGLEVPHTHVHLIPINQVSDMNFAQPKQSYTSEALAELASAIASA